jgi:hypothetical protein
MNLALNSKQLRKHDLVMHKGKVYALRTIQLANILLTILFDSLAV